MINNVFTCLFLPSFAKMCWQYKYSIADDDVLYFTTQRTKKILNLIFFSHDFPTEITLVQDYGLKVRLGKRVNVPLYSISTLNVLQIDTFLLRFYSPFSIKMKCIFLRSIKTLSTYLFRSFNQND